MITGNGAGNKVHLIFGPPASSPVLAMQFPVSRAEDISSTCGRGIKTTSASPRLFTEINLTYFMKLLTQGFGKWTWHLAMHNRKRKSLWKMLFEVPLSHDFCHIYYISIDLVYSLEPLQGGPGKMINITIINEKQVSLYHPVNGFLCGASICYGICVTG